MKSAPMNLALSLSHDYLPYAYTLLLSLRQNNTNPLNIYILHQDLTENDGKVFDDFAKKYSVRFFFLPVSPSQAEALRTCRVYDAAKRAEAYFYLLIPELVPAGTDRILYLDADTIVNGSLEPLYFSIPDDSLPAFCRQDGIFSKGMLLLPLPCDRSFLEEALFEAKNPDTLWHPDPEKYNLSARYAFTTLAKRYEDVKASAAVVHFNGSKPWEGNCLRCEIEQLWWDYAKDSPYCEALMKQTMHAIMTDPTIATYVSNLKAEHRQLEEVLSQYEVLLKNYGIPF